MSALQNLSSLDEYVVIKRYYTEDRTLTDIARELKISRHAGFDHLSETMLALVAHLAATPDLTAQLTGNRSQEKSAAE